METSEELKEIGRMLETNEVGLTSFLIENLKPLTDFDEHKVKQYQQALYLIQEMAWIEHTCDWDLYYIIKMKDGSEIETQSGYAEIDLEKTNKLYIYFHSEPEQDDETINEPYSRIEDGEYHLMIPKDKIKSIEVSD